MGVGVIALAFVSKWMAHMVMVAEEAALVMGEGNEKQTDETGPFLEYPPQTVMVMGEPAVVSLAVNRL